jgi:cytoskeletal protein RodZ
MEEQRVNAPTGVVPGKGYAPAHRHKKRELTMWAQIVLLVVVVVVVAAVTWWVVTVHNNSNTNSESSAVNTSEYQAVFLTNGQVYFGKLKVVNPNYLKLTNIYYLQVQSTSSDTTSASQLSASTSGTSGNNVQLVKLGNELQGPENMMAINREQVLFWENLKPSGKVTQAIDTYLKNQQP